jgi:hypothetical protein
MLRRVENVWVEFRYGLGFSTTGRARVHIGNQTVTFGWMKERGSTTNSRWSSRPIRSGWQRSCERTYWQFQDRVYWENGASTPMRFMPCSSQSSSESAAASNEPKRWLQWACSHRTRRAAGT